MSRRQRMLADLDRDIRDHLERETQDNLERGMPPHKARYAALRKFGNVDRVRETTREGWSIVWLEQLWQDVRFGLRALRRSAAFTAAAVLTLALGIGVNTSVFSLVYSLALRPLPVSDPARVVSVYEQFHGRYSRGVYGQPNLLSYPEYVAYRDANRAFSGLAAYADVSLSVGGAAGQPAAGLLASCNYFALLGSDVARGRGLSPEDCRSLGAGSAAVISDRFWRSRFHGDPAALGKSLTLNQRAFTIVGIARSDFGGTELQTPDVWLPLTIAPRRRCLAWRGSWMPALQPPPRPCSTRWKRLSRLRGCWLRWSGFSVCWR